MVGALGVTKGTEVFLMSSCGQAIRQKVDAISRQQRDSTGVRVMQMGDNSELAAYAVVPPEEEE